MGIKHALELIKLIDLEESEFQTDGLSSWRQFHFHFDERLHQASKNGMNVLTEPAYTVYPGFFRVSQILRKKGKLVHVLFAAVIFCNLKRYIGIC